MQRALSPSRRRILAAFAICAAVIPTVQARNVNADIAAACPGYMAWGRAHSTPDSSLAQAAPEGSDAALTAELLKMFVADQQARNAAIAGGPEHRDPIALNHMLVLDQRNLKSLHEIIAAGGIPTLQRVGGKGMSAFWLLVQHADTEPQLQEQVLKAISTADSGVSRGDIALLTDRVRIHKGLPQIYGSQFRTVGKDMVPDPIEDEAHVDERRATMGLAPMADYTCIMRVLYNVAPAK